jgi:hypothetical protein
VSRRLAGRIARRTDIDNRLKRAVLLLAGRFYLHWA